MHNQPMQTSDFHYHLPQSLIAQKPCKPRDHARLMVLHRTSTVLSTELSTVLAHTRFDALPELLQPGDVLVFNNSKVIKARLVGKKDTGGKMEVFLLRRVAGLRWEVLVGGKGARSGKRIIFGRAFFCTLQKHDENRWIAEFNLQGKSFHDALETYGHVPLPPYIKTSSRFSDYQTVYAAKEGSVAAPTAGLHFTPRLLRALQKRGIGCEYITLHVGLGTFQSVKTDRIEDHIMHAEFAEISARTAARLNKAKKQGRRIIAVGTTSVRTLEAFTNKRGILQSGARDVNIFIYPGYDFRFVNGVITNFHLPQSSLLMLVSAFAGREKVMRAYEVAKQKNYRFYSFGDAMLIM